MNAIDEAKEYIEATLGLNVEFKPTRKFKLPFFIQDSYKFFPICLKLGDNAIFSALLIEPVTGTYPGVVTLRKNLGQIEKVTDDTLIFLNSCFSASDRRSMIRDQINFLQPGFQMYIPELALDLREARRIRREKRVAVKLFPAAQAILIANLHSGWSTNQEYTARQLMGTYNYSRVTLAKVVEQFISHGIIDTGNKTNHYQFTGSESDIYQKAYPFLKSPIKNRVAINRIIEVDDDVFVSGESALARYSMLAEPTLPVYAMTAQTFSKRLSISQFSIAEGIDQIAAYVEIGTYQSQKKQVADELSLMLSFATDKDERIQIALDEIKEKIGWLKSGD
ncbi:hypothetical protein SC206_02220 [Rouxiella sp. T17]|uniref:hypothetical protein n=1 Tax=Rouxiella sp. T17 TaxID=3085684 RepID=UPI002FC938DE